MNRREFTALFGASLANLAISKDTLLTNESTSVVHQQLEKYRRFWQINFDQSPESYLLNKKMNATNIDKLNKEELEKEHILEFEGVYFSFCELAILASLSPIAV